MRRPPAPPSSARRVIERSLDPPSPVRQPDPTPATSPAPRLERHAPNVDRPTYRPSSATARPRGQPGGGDEHARRPRRARADRPASGAGCGAAHRRPRRPRRAGSLRRARPAAGPAGTAAGVRDSRQPRRPRCPARCPGRRPARPADGRRVRAVCGRRLPGPPGAARHLGARRQPRCALSDPARLAGGDPGGRARPPDPDRHAPPALRHRDRPHGPHRPARAGGVRRGAGAAQAGAAGRLRARAPRDHHADRRGGGLRRPLGRAPGRAGSGCRGAVRLHDGAAVLPAAPLVAGRRVRHPHRAGGAIPRPVPVPDRGRHPSRYGRCRAM